MPSMTKRVNVYAQVAVRNVTPPICGTCKDIIMTTGDILKCLCKRARVEEILPNGKTIRLNMSNYYTDNGAGLDASKSVTKEVKKVEEPARFKVPVAPKAQVVETKTVEEPKPLEEVHAVDTVMVEYNTMSAVNETVEVADAEPTVFVTGMTVGEEVSDEANAGGIVGYAVPEVIVDNCTNTSEATTTSTNVNYNNNQHHNNKKKHKK